MGIRFACHQCQKPLNIKRELAGKRGVCPACGTRFRIPLDDAAQSIPVISSQTHAAAGAADEAVDGFGGTGFETIWVEEPVDSHQANHAEVHRAAPAISHRSDGSRDAGHQHNVVDDVASDPLADVLVSASASPDTRQAGDARQSENRQHAGAHREHVGTVDGSHASVDRNPSAVSIGQWASAGAGQTVQAGQAGQPKVANVPQSQAVVPLPRAAPSLLDDPIAVWYVRPPSGGQYGPASGELLRTWISESRITASSLVWRDGWAQWRTASEVLVEFGAKEHGTVTSAGTVETTAGFSLPPGEVPAARAMGAASADSPLSGDSKIGKLRGKRSHKRLLTISALFALSVVLIGVLIYILQS